MNETVIREKLKELTGKQSISKAIKIIVMLNDIEIWEKDK